MPTILGVIFGRGFFWGPEALDKQGRKISGKTRWRNLLRNALAIFLKFAGPIRKFTPTPLCRISRSTNVCLFSRPKKIRKLEKAVAVRNSLLERFSGKIRRYWQMIPRFSGSAYCYPCQGLGTFRQGKRLLENWPRLRERCWIFSSETATAFLSFSRQKKKDIPPRSLFSVPNLCPRPPLLYVEDPYPTGRYLDQKV